jgi:hypothetical protein
MFATEQRKNNIGASLSWRVFDAWSGAMISSEPVADSSPVSPPAGWTTQVHIGAVFEGGHSYHAQVFRDRQCLCHIVLAGVAIEAERADEVLTIRVRNWIEAFETRDLSRCGALQAPSM